MDESGMTSDGDGGDDGRGTAGVLAPPPLIFAAPLLVGWLVDRYVTGWASGVDATWRYGVAVVLAVLAVGFAPGALHLFRRAGTPAEPWHPTTAIVTTGIYRITRNPMYVGMTLLYAGIAVAVDSLVALALLPLTLIVIQVGVIRREERYLEARFGDDYRGYKARVRRWI